MDKNRQSREKREYQVLKFLRRHYKIIEKMYCFEYQIVIWTKKDICDEIRKRGGSAFLKFLIQKFYSLIIN